MRTRKEKAELIGLRSLTSLELSFSRDCVSGDAALATLVSDGWGDAALETLVNDVWGDAELVTLVNDDWGDAALVTLVNDDCGEATRSLLIRRMDDVDSCEEER